MPQEIPNLAGVVTSDLIETIGAGSYKASYLNWARTQNLLHEHAPGWLLESVYTGNGEMVHRAPGNGGFLLLRFRHLDGTLTPEVPQAIMDNRNNPIPYEKISSRDVTDTHRRGGCLAAAMTFGLAYELWAKMPLESGYGVDADIAPVNTPASSQAAKATKSSVKNSSVTKEQFLEAAIAKGLTTYAAESLASKLNNNYAGGIDRLKDKDEAWVKTFNESCAPKDGAEQW